MFVCTIRESLELKLLEWKHAPELFQLTERNRDYLREWLPWVDITRSEEDSKQFISMVLEQFAQNRGFQCGIFYEGRLAGCIGFHRIDWTNRKTSIGYWLDEQAQGKGIMADSCRRLLDYAFEELNLNRVEIRAGVGNAKSRAIPERLGFQLEGVCRQEEWVNDRFVDHAVYAMLADDWNSHIRR
ncbi:MULTISPECIES: GNAT family N-acetyltransferase [unclassified Paenibacillus]|uniref:GNAT family N-acetyltransferase n=1 Tax=unclassified Paenibacillus TaxID=185978 RepID=UPI001C119A66|nr:MULTISPECIES: GNAT family N-acetyltransferase [unclassified Paenibacillus]MBU5444591.1 GNAT family N-acetyltransferase [Paenibacillus sp. MSJ-34]CAH0117918.1 Putative ribosomal N-acetyltransferase YdaF [Paenibacillus sp. CECT 9249]